MLCTATLACLTFVAQPVVEVRDWFASTHVTNEEAQAFVFEPDGPLPYVATQTLQTTQSATVPAATLDSAFDFRAGDDGARFEMTLAAASGPSPDLDNDGPQVQLFFLLRVNEPVEYDFFAVSSIDEVTPGNVPILAVLVHDQYCFEVGYRPADPVNVVGCPFTQAIIDLPRLSTGGTTVNFDTPCDPPEFCRPDMGSPAGTLMPGDYTVVALAGAFTNAGADVASEVVLTFGTPPADCGAADLNLDSLLNNADINAFVSAFLAANPIADLTADGLFNNADINAFVSAFLSGCD